MQLKINAYNKQVITNNKLCYWELTQNKSYWSSAFITNLGYCVHKLPIGLDFFLDNIIHPDFKQTFRDNFYNLVRYNIAFKQNILLINKNKEQLDFVCTTDDALDLIYGKENSNNIYFFKSKINTHEKVRGSNFYYLETADMTSTGSWYVDFENKKSYWDNITRRILEYPDDFIPSVKKIDKIINLKHKSLVLQTFYECSKFGKPFDIEILVNTAKNRKIWARAKGKPVFDKDKNIIGLRGVFQDIDDRKQNEIKIEYASRIVKSQNSRLFNFAHIVSHNLRSHTSNLSLILQMINEVKDVNEKLELLDNLTEVSDSLNSTINHLNEVVTVHSSVKEPKEIVRFDETLNRACVSISQMIASNKASIITDFSAVESVKYIPAYMDSIFLNLLSNAIKYRDEVRIPKIEIKTYYCPDDESRICLKIKDNGRGIDLDKFGDKIFGMYKTFHYNKDATGIGLFITKNQIESLNGTIEVESKVNEGTTFSITF